MSGDVGSFCGSVVGFSWSRAVSSSSPESVSASQNMVPRAESSMMRPLGAVSVAGVGIERGRSGSMLTGCTTAGFQSSFAADTSLMGDIMRA